jgi:hypothetical protein
VAGRGIRARARHGLPRDARMGSPHRPAWLADPALIAEDRSIDEVESVRNWATLPPRQAGSTWSTPHRNRAVRSGHQRYIIRAPMGSGLVKGLASVFHERGWAGRRWWRRTGAGGHASRWANPARSFGWCGRTLPGRLVGSVRSVAGSRSGVGIGARRGARLLPGGDQAQTVDGQQRSGSARSRANARASAAAHGQVACSRRMVRRAWRTIRAATCSSR